MGLARSLLVHDKYTICALCQVVPNWARLGGDLAETPRFCSML